MPVVLQLLSRIRSIGCSGAEVPGGVSRDPASRGRRFCECSFSVVDRMVFDRNLSS